MSSDDATMAAGSEAPGGVGPLNGFRVVELAMWVAGPSAAGTLADWGADVIKIEPPKGDPQRHIFGALGHAVQSSELGQIRTGVSTVAHVQFTPARRGTAGFAIGRPLVEGGHERGGGLDPGPQQHQYRRRAGNDVFDFPEPPSPQPLVDRTRTDVASSEIVASDLVQQRSVPRPSP